MLRYSGATLRFPINKPVIWCDIFKPTDQIMVIDCSAIKPRAKQQINFASPPGFCGGKVSLYVDLTLNLKVDPFCKKMSCHQPSQTAKV